MPSTPSDRLGLTAPLTTENADGPTLAQDLIDGLEASVGMAKIDSKVATTGDTSIGFTGIPAVFKHLKLRGFMRVTTGPSAVAANMRLNGDSTAAHYAWLSDRFDTSTQPVRLGNASDDEIYVGDVMPTANRTMAFEIDILGYSKTNAYKAVIVKSLSQYLGGEKLDLMAWWLSTAAVNAVSLYATGGTPGLANDTEVDLYGIL
jgi:hypothetical protein